MASVVGAAVVLPRDIESSTSLSATATLAALVFHTGEAGTRRKYSFFFRHEYFGFRRHSGILA